MVYKKGKTRYKIFSERLKEAMEFRKVQNKTLAQMLCISPQALSGYRQGRRGPDVVQLSLIAKSLNVSVDFLLGLKDDMEIIE